MLHHRLRRAEPALRQPGAASAAGGSALSKASQRRSLTKSPAMPSWACYMMLMRLMPLESLAEVNGPMQGAIPATETVFEMIESKVEEETGTRELGQAQGRLRLENVSCRYSNLAGLALHEVSLDIQFAATAAEK
jgi:subfamily B ATP-binding cassette protein MsbA